MLAHVRRRHRGLIRGCWATTGSLLAAVLLWCVPDSSGAARAAPEHWCGLCWALALRTRGFWGSAVLHRLRQCVGLLEQPQAVQDCTVAGDASLTLLLIVAELHVGLGGNSMLFLGRRHIITQDDRLARGVFLVTIGSRCCWGMGRCLSRCIGLARCRLSEKRRKG